MSDRELLELAAKAAGIGPVISLDDHGLVIGPRSNIRLWNPIADDAQAFRLAISLRIDLTFYNGFQEVHAEPSNSDGLSPSDEKFGDDILSATRRAIVRAAAEIGRQML